MAGAGLDRASRPGVIAFCEKLFAANLDGHRADEQRAHLRGSARWPLPARGLQAVVHFNGRAPVVLMGDAAHTAHFPIGSGTKLALEDAIELAASSAHRRAARDLRGRSRLRPRRRASTC